MMKHLFDSWAQFEKLTRGKSMALFLDYDGTLSTITPVPDKARLPSRTKALLDRLAKKTNFRLSIVSGRALDDIKERVSVNGIVYVGNHGMQIQGPKIKFTKQLPAGYIDLLRRIKRELFVRLTGFKGVIIEDKGLSLSVHYRMVENSRVPQLKTTLRETTIIHSVKGEISIKSGKKVFEIRPAVAWDKGKAVLWLLCRWRFGACDMEMVPVYIGDDSTDEDAFKAMGNKGVSVFVGKPHKSAAKYYLNDTAQVTSFLERVERLNHA